MTRILLLFIVFLFINKISGQEVSECSTPLLSPEEMVRYVEHLPLIKKQIPFKNGEKHLIPLYFTVLRNDDGSETMGNFEPVKVDQDLINATIQRINEVFLPAGFEFYQLSDIAFINNTELRKLKQSYRNFSYVSTALNVVIGGLTNSGIVGSANMPLALPPADNYSNTLWVRSGKELLSPTFIHELGHSFGLFHTFEGARLYDNPKDPLKNVPDGIRRYLDHPGRNKSNFFKRELVIRADVKDFSKNFNYHNADVAGDFVEDTPASCATMSKQDFPDWSDPKCKSYHTMGNCYHGCVYDPDECIYIGNYVDYNGDTIQNADVMVRNFMSYTGKCRSEFTKGQFKRMSFYYDIYRKRQFDPNQNINIKDFVHIEDSEIGLPNVQIQFEHPFGDGKHCNVTTDENGQFQGILYENEVQIKQIRKLGKNKLDDYSEEEWNEGINTDDVISILHHILGVNKLNGYRQIAADVNNDGKITLLDALELRNFLMGKKDNALQQNSPWRFIPESITKNYPVAFHKNPFNMVIDGTQYEHEAPYLAGDWVQNLENGMDGMSGFAAVKIGDVNGSLIEENEEEPVTYFKRNEPNGVSAGYEGLVLSNVDFKVIVDRVKEEEPILESIFDPVSIFPNPTEGSFEINYQSNQPIQGQVMIMDAFGKTLHQEQQEFFKGINKILVDNPHLPSGILKVSIIAGDQHVSNTVLKTGL